MLHYIKFIGLMLVLILIIATAVMGQPAVQFKHPIAFSVVGCKTDTLWFGVNSGDGIIHANTYGQDTEPDWGVTGTWKELMYPSFPIGGYSFVPYFIEIPSRVATPPVWSSSKMRPYDYRGCDGSMTDTFQITVKTGDSLADGFPATGITLSWSNTLLKNYIICMLLKKMTSTTYGVVADMLTTTSWVDDDSIKTIGQSSVTYLIKMDRIVGVEEYTTLQPTKFELGQNYPNPFNPTTAFKFSVAKKGLTTLKVYNTLGQEVMNLFDGMAESGKMYQVSFDGSKLASGVYFYRLISSEKSDIKKMVLLK